MRTARGTARIPHASRLPLAGPSSCASECELSVYACACTCACVCVDVCVRQTQLSPASDLSHPRRVAATADSCLGAARRWSPSAHVHAQAPRCSLASSPSSFVQSTLGAHTARESRARDILMAHFLCGARARIPHLFVPCAAYLLAARRLAASSLVSQA